MATETTQTKPATKNDKDSPTIEVKEETSTESSPKGASKVSPTTDTPKPAAAPTATPTAIPAAVKADLKPAPSATSATTPATAKEEPKPAPAANPAAAKTEAKPAAQEAPKPAAPKPPPAVDTVSRVGRAEAIVRRNVLWSLGAGVVPFPLFDAIAIAGVQLKMLSELSELYKVNFTESIAKKLIGSLISSVGGVALGTAVGASLVKLIPGVGTALGIVSVPLIGGACTHATGAVFVMHFEAGGTLLDFDPHKMRSHFRQEFEKAKQAVADLHKTEQAKTSKSS